MPEEKKKGKFSIDGAIILVIAMILDVIGLFLFVLSFFGIGIPLSFIPDVIGTLTIGLWLLFTKGKTTGFKLAQKLGTATAIELVPFLGDLAPSWTLLVLSEIGIVKIPFLG